jgi:murein DD-endopeptidase MepM/ murein hydrolase activator NlpD
MPRRRSSVQDLAVAFAAGAVAMLLLTLAIRSYPTSSGIDGEGTDTGSPRPTVESILPSRRDQPSAAVARPDAGHDIQPPETDHGTRKPPAGDASASLRTLRARNLLIPVTGITRDQLQSSFSDTRSGSRSHEAIDILAPRRTPVRAVEDGVIAKLFLSKAGGTTVYQFDPSGDYAYYYAHLEGYAPGLKDGAEVRRGQTIGFVGTSGNAPPETPHLHFAIFKLTAEKTWWEGEPIDPYAVWSGG